MTEIDRGRMVLFVRAERMYEPGAGVSLDALMASLPPVDQAAVRAFLAAELACLDAMPSSFPLSPLPGA